MARNPDDLPEGTDAVIDGGGNDVAFQPAPALEAETGGEPEFTAAPGIGAGTRREEFTRKLDEKTADLRGQAAGKAREYALIGKDKATTALDDVVRMIGESAGTIDEKVGPQYGDYARRAADAVASLSSTLQQKDVDELFEDARDAVRKSPALAIGAAAALGFVVARLVKAGVPDATAAAASDHKPDTAA